MEKPKKGLKIFILPALLAAVILLDMVVVNLAIGAPFDFTGDWISSSGSSFTITNQDNHAFQFQLGDLSGRAEITRKNTAEFQYTSPEFPNGSVTISFQMQDKRLIVQTKTENIPSNSAFYPNGEYYQKELNVSSSI